jgi:Histidine kinase-, DNA gyrase B-, and HSP90-like ATPase
VPSSRDPKRVEATPEKRFFISMLVKDIELIPAILDLVDNSIDGAKRLRQRKRSQRFSGLYVRLDLKPDRFFIEDNCGGIEASHAREYAFRFGRPQNTVQQHAGEVGQFGVGMKRALFKLGSSLWIESVAHHSSFILPVDVDEWAQDLSPDWSFEFQEVDEATDHSTNEQGTKIEVTKLHPSVSTDFQNESFLSRVRAALELRHQEALQAGIELELGDIKLTPIVPLLRSSDQFSPMHIQQDININGGTVHMELFAGIAGEQPVVNVGDDDGEGENFRKPSRAGWYLFCNDRLLLASDQTQLTGWGTAGAAYHPQYRLFRGYVYLTAADSSLLPWNTTKTGVDEDSAVFRRVQSEMFDALRMVQAVINRAKKERQDRDPDDRPVLSAMTAAPSVTLDVVPESDTFVVPADPPRTRRSSTTKKIAYTVDAPIFERVADELGTSSAADVGRLTFRYYVEHEIPDE